MTDRDYIIEERNVFLRDSVRSQLLPLPYSAGQVVHLLH